MKRKTKRRIGIFLVVAMLAVLVFPAFSAMADGEADFTINGGVLEDYHGAGGDVTIPDSVTTIADEAFQDDDGVTSVTIPGSVSSIGAYAFSECSNMVSVSVPSSVTSMGVGVFSNCSSLSNIDFSASITTLPQKTFFNCESLSSIIIPSGIGTIGDDAFAECVLLGSINIPAGVSVISNTAFDGCGNLTSITVSSGNSNYSSYDGCIYNRGMTKLLICPAGKSSIQTAGNASTYGTGSFSGCNAIDTLNIPNNITTIEGNAFSNSGIQTITIPSSVRSIGSQASWDPAVIYTYAGSAGESFAAAYGYTYELLNEENPVDPTSPTDPENPTSPTDPTDPTDPGSATGGADTSQSGAAGASGSGASVSTGSGSVTTTAGGASGSGATGGAHVLDNTPTTGPELNARVVLCVAVFFVGIYLIISSRKEEKTA